MPSRKKAAVWHLVFSYLTVAYGIASGLMLIPIYLRFLAFELYGALLTAGNILHRVYNVRSHTG